MKASDKIIKFRIKPYIQEAILQFVIDIIVIALVTVVFIVAKFPIIAFIAVDLVYMIVALILHYRVSIQAITDKNKRDCVTETISIKQFNEERSFAGDRLGCSYLRLFYPKEMQVGKYKLKVINESGEEKKLRAVMSFKQTLNFIVFDKNQIEYLDVTYLKKSKIIVSFDLVGDVDKIASKRKKEEVKKVINHINFSV